MRVILLVGERRGRRHPDTGNQRLRVPTVVLDRKMQDRKQRVIDMAELPNVWVVFRASVTN